MNIVSTLKLEKVKVNKLKKFISHWQKIKDLPCEKISFRTVNKNTILLDMYYPINIFDKSVTQFMTVLFGEISFVTNFGKVIFMDLKLPKTVYRWFGGPKFGAEILKKRFRAKNYPLLVAIIKPSLGKALNIKKIEQKITSVLKGRFHAIKDDEMQGNLPNTPLNKRILLAKKYRKYIPAINVDDLDSYRAIMRSKNADKIGMIILNASTIGFPLLHEIRKITRVPILSHVAMQGLYSTNFSPKVFALLHRLFGCDAFTNPIGDVDYFNISKQGEKEMAMTFTKKSPIKKTLPLLTGGARLNNLAAIIKPYEKLKIPYGVVFGSLIFASSDTPKNMCEKTNKEIAKIKSKKY